MKVRIGMPHFSAGMLAMLGIVAGALALPANYEDPLGQPATMTDLALRAPILAIVGAGTGLIAVGQRGHILREGSPEASWQQVAVPVSTDLVGLWFSSSRSGWAVGHDGIVLSSNDGGLTWQRRLDGREAYQIELSYYESLAARGGEAALREIKYLNRMAAEAPAWPFLDVWFKNHDDGYLVGAFGMILHTSDGGNRWSPMTDRTENPKRRHLYAVRGDADDIYIAGEQGTALRFDRSRDRFVQMTAPFKGSFFGVAVQGARIVLYGLNGHALLSEDRGGTWRQLQTETTQSLVGHAAGSDGELLFATQGGTVIRLCPAGTRMSAIGSVMAGEVFGITTTGKGDITVATSNGPKAVRLRRGPDTATSCLHELARHEHVSQRTIP